MTRIRFVCQHCGQRLSAGVRRAGQAVDCPKCHLSTRIPHETASPAKVSSASAAAPSDSAPSSADSPSAEALSPPRAADDEDALFPEFSVYDEETEWVYEREEDEHRPGAVDPQKVAVSRRILYLQGVLLGVTSLAAFVLGVVFGRSLTPRQTAAAAPTPCRLTGKIEYSRGGLDAVPDAGAIVIAVPRDSKPDRQARTQLEQLVSVTDENDPVVSALRSFGGDFALADDAGQFDMRVPDAGHYYLLVLSANSQRPAQSELNREHLSQMGNYFGPALRLLGDRRYQWRSEHVTRDRQLDVVF